MPTFALLAEPRWEVLRRRFSESAAFVFLETSCMANRTGKDRSRQGRFNWRQAEAWADLKTGRPISEAHSGGRSPRGIERSTLPVLLILSAFNIGTLVSGSKRGVQPAHLDDASRRLLDRSGSSEKAGQNAATLVQPIADVRPGTSLSREWHRRMQRVMVLADGFAWNSKGTHPSLSRVAFAIIGTRWNGPRFFGLRDNSSKRSAQ